MKQLTPEQVRDLLDYNPLTGVFLWRNDNKQAMQVKAGAVAGYVNALGYRRIVVAGERHLAHRLAWFYVTGRWPLAPLDHINGNPSDNSFSNLREATPSQNSRNKKLRSDSGSGLKGVGWHKGNKRYVAKISVAGRRIHLGYFKCPTSAYFAYCKAAKDHYGDFARLK